MWESDPAGDWLVHLDSGLFFAEARSGLASGSGGPVTFWLSGLLMTCLELLLTN